MIDAVLNLPGLVAAWDFREAGCTAQGANACTLEVMHGAPEHTPEGLYLRRGEWLRAPRPSCPALDIHGTGAQGPDIRVALIILSSKYQICACVKFFERLHLDPIFRFLDGHYSEI